MSKCTGCKKCEVACSFFHTGRVSRRQARIKVLNLYELGLDGPVACVQCEERYCLVCPEDAMAVGPLGQVIISPTMCTLCEACEKACPIGAIEIFEKLVYVCDFCGGKPKCVDACTERAIEFVTGDKKAPSLSAIKKETSKMSPGQKRKHYLTKSGASLRKRWTQRHA